MAVAPVVSMPLRTVRRCKDLVLMGDTVRLGLRCNGCERVVRRHVENEVTQLVARRLKRNSEGIQHALVLRSLFVPDCVRVVLANEAIRDRDARAHGLAEAARIGDRQPVELATRVDGEAVIGRTVPTNGVEGFEGQTQRVHQPVTAVTGGIGAMNFEPLAFRERHVGRGIGQHRVDVRGWRRNGRAHKRFAHELAAQRGRSLLLIGELREEPHLAENPDARPVGRQRAKHEGRRRETGRAKTVELRELRIDDDLRCREEVESARLVVERKEIGRASCRERVYGTV